MVDISKSGMGVQPVATALQPSTTVDFSVVVSQFGVPIEGTAQIIWVRGGQSGLRFTQVPENGRQRIAEWIRTITTTPDNDREIASAQQTAALPFHSSAPNYPNEKTIATCSTSPAVDQVDPFPLSQRAIETCVTKGGWSIYMVGMFESNRFRIKTRGQVN